MNYKAIFLKSYHLTMRNPILWVFGLFLSSGFNLNIFYALASHRSGIVWEAIRGFLSGRPILVGLSGVGAAIAFLLVNYIKAWFVSESHELVHPQGEKCNLCAKRDQRHTWQQRLPSFGVLIKVILASVLTIGATVVSAAPLNYLLMHQTPPGAISVTVIATLVIICAIACWNAFVVYYLMLYKQRFGSAARLSFDLITLRGKHVFEFVALLVLIYIALVGVGSLLITVAQANVDWTGLPFLLINSAKATFGFLFGVWLAITNTFFNLALFLFFDQLVKPVEKAEPVTAALPQSAQ